MDGVAEVKLDYFGFRFLVLVLWVNLVVVLVALLLGVTMGLQLLQMRCPSSDVEQCVGSVWMLVR